MAAGLEVAGLRFLVNPTGRFAKGGPAADTGLTGRKIIADTYGGYARHGGGAFSGKDPTKVDRSAAYMARYIAKNIVAAGLADRCEVQLAYAIGVAHPVSVMVETFGTGIADDQRLADLVNDVFDMQPKAIIEKLEAAPAYLQDHILIRTFRQCRRTQPGGAWHHAPLGKHRHGRDASKEPVNKPVSPSPPPAVGRAEGIPGGGGGITMKKSTKPTGPILTPTLLRAIAEAAAEKGVEAYRREVEVQRVKARDRRFQNTKLLLEKYKGLEEHSKGCGPERLTGR